MKKAITGFFEEQPGVKSWTRMSMTLIIATACLCALIVVISAVLDGEYNHTGLIVSMFTIATGGKVAQKIFGEKKPTIINEDSYE